MPFINENYKNIKESYLFSDIAKRVAAYKETNKDASVILMGIGDVTLPLSKAVVDAMKKACDEMGKKESFKGYGPEQGYEFLKKAVMGYYSGFGVELKTSEIFISDGAKSDIGNITDIFSNENSILIPDPVYPVYVDSNLMLGRNILYLDANQENGFLPTPDERHADLIYLCSPNNPTGAVYTREQLIKWVDYALANNAVILFDAAYESFIGDKGLPRSIYEIPGANKCAVEFCSLSKTAGFTGTRCGYTIVPEELKFKVSDGSEMSLNRMWNRRQTTKFNGVSYIIQRGAEAVFSDEGKRQISEATVYYKRNARLISDTLKDKGIYFTGGVNSPYVWMKCPNGMGSWEFFDFLLNSASVVGTPGAGFGRNGEGYFRLTAFGSYENTSEAMKRFKKVL